MDLRTTSAFAQNVH